MKVFAYSWKAFMNVLRVSYDIFLNFVIDY